MGGITVLHTAAFLQTGKDPNWHVQQFHPIRRRTATSSSCTRSARAGGGC